MSYSLAYFIIFLSKKRTYEILWNAKLFYALQAMYVCIYPNPHRNTWHWYLREVIWCDLQLVRGTLYIWTDQLGIWFV